MSMNDPREQGARPTGEAGDEGGQPRSTHVAARWAACECAARAAMQSHDSAGAGDGVSAVGARPIAKER